MKTKQLIRILLALTLISVYGVKENTAGAQDSKTTDTATVHMIEYSDYQCPTCAYFFPIVEKLKEHFGDQLQIEYRFFPLTMHQFSALAARAAQSAKNQGKFLEMHKLLFENQNTWVSSGNPQAVFIGYARQIGLDMAQFKEDLNAAATQRTVMEEKEEGIRDEVNATPTFFINGKKLEQLPMNYEQFKGVIEAQIKAGT